MSEPNYMVPPEAKDYSNTSPQIPLPFEDGHIYSQEADLMPVKKNKPWIERLRSPRRDVVTPASEKRQVGWREILTAIRGGDIEGKGTPSSTEKNTIVSLRDEGIPMVVDDSEPSTEVLSEDPTVQPESTEEEIQEHQSFFEAPPEESEPEIKVPPLTVEQRKTADEKVKKEGMNTSDISPEQVFGVKPHRNIDIAKGWDSFLRKIGYRVSKEDLENEGDSIFEPIFQAVERTFSPPQQQKQQIEPPIKRSVFTNVPDRMVNGMTGMNAQTTDELRKANKVISLRDH